MRSVAGDVATRGDHGQPPRRFLQRPKHSGASGGIVIVQDPHSAEFAGMPAAAIETGAVDFVLPLDAIGPVLDDLVHGRAVPA